MVALTVVVCSRPGVADAPPTADAVAASASTHTGDMSLVPAPSPRVRMYHALVYALLFEGELWPFAGLAALAFTGLARRLWRSVERRVRPPGLRLPAYLGIVLAGLALWQAPVRLLGYAVNRAFGFATHGPALWLADIGRDALFALIGVPVIWLAYALVRRSPRRWWLWLWAASVPWLLATTVLYPEVVAPAYNRFRPMAPSPLRSRIDALARRAGAGRPRVLVVDSSRRTTMLNAYVTGLGPTARIVLWDTTLRALTTDEVVAITAHELGHYVLRHVWLGFVASALGALALLAVGAAVAPTVIRTSGAAPALSHPAGLPAALLVFQALLLAQMPAASALSRLQERQADRFALRLIGDGRSLAHALAAFVERDYADPVPPALVQFWFGTHPPLRDRIRSAVAYRPTAQRGSVSRSVLAVSSGSVSLMNAPAPASEPARYLSLSSVR